jgi:hypothetical protein
MWDCEHCGCRQIAGSLGFCPMCRTPKEEAVPRITAGGGASNAAEDKPAQPVPEPEPSVPVQDDPETEQDGQQQEPEQPPAPPVPEPPAQPQTLKATVPPKPKA